MPRRHYRPALRGNENDIQDPAAVLLAKNEAPDRPFRTLLYRLSNEEAVS